MKTSVIICSVNRAAILHDTVLSITRQTYQPMEILLVSPDKQHILTQTLEIPGVRFVPGPLGLPSQRNAGLSQANLACDLIAFFDDDIELCTSYLKEMANLFSKQTNIVIASGRLLHDGGRGAMITREKSRELCDLYEKNQPHAASTYTGSNSAYGCNMIVRYSATKDMRFDEGLPLYAWLEDRDYSHRLTQHAHMPVEFSRAVAVHLGSRSGRIGGMRMGFSEIINPLYLWAKNKTFSMSYIIVQYWLRCLAGNVLGLLKGDSEYDRLGLLKGNIAGFVHLLKGQCDPSYIMQIKPNNSERKRHDSPLPDAVESTAS